ncbi:restriction endonuclease subunit S [Aestuariibacter halophilus]|uniref:Restriction endonuclease subunit S n=1 Tax=Fluctibacter halophilus TaxID=226011 RepID=A0ABS8G6F2_9ALTE|nr:restriction endonuclease subunit S [Aestuariibacter halophilus]MCC2616172.1 restriction endonuclease subunit S [Aestuariibacter halophilus]
MSVESVITENLDIWTTAIKRKSASGRGTSNKLELYGIKKLRELILELAVRGKLVPQYTTEEPVQILLEQIEEEKIRLIKEKKLKKAKKLESISIDDFPFDIPKTWKFERLGNVVDIVRGITFPASAKESDSNEDNIACLRTANVQDVIDWDDLIYVNKSFVKRDDQYLLKNDIVMSMANSRELVGKVAFADFIPINSSFGGFLSVLRPRKLLPDYVMLFLRTPYARETLIGSASQTTNIANISLEKLNPLTFPVPPREEQVRIATKVKELMGICDQLESQTEASFEAHKTLVETLLSTLTNAKDADELNESWERISEHFDTLFTTEDSIDQLKQTVLQLAVMGKLVKQDPNDEPASKLLERIAAEKEQLIKDKKIKRQKALTPIAKSELPYELPNGWIWCRVGDVLETISDYHANGGYKILKENVQLLDQKDFAIMLRTTNFSKKNYSEYKYISEKAYHFLEKSKLYPNDIIMNKIGDPGSTFYVDDRGQPMSLAMNLFLLRVSLANSKYIFKYLNGNYDYVKSFANGTSTQTITKDAVNNLLCPLPPLFEQQRIVAKIDELFEICESLNAQIDKAKLLQNWLAQTISSSLVN